MDDGIPHLADRYLDQNGRQLPRQEYSLLQPQFKQPPRLLPPRDRYRASRDGPPYDRVEDDEFYERDAQLNSFEESSTQQPCTQRQRQAGIGQARHSFQPQPFRYGSVGDSAHTHPAYCMREEARVLYEQPRLARYMYDARQPPEPSSDTQIGTLSSPAFLAGQRRGGPVLINDASPTEKTRTDEENARFDSHPDLQIFPQTRRRASAETPKPQNNTPVCQGIPLVPVRQLPDRLRTIFPYPTFNAIQSKCFDKVYRSDDNFVLASPTGSGKTVVLELAICRAIATCATSQYKIVYQAPTKALCSERQRDWQSKFGTMGMNCVELTGDTDAGDLRNVQSANIIVTTPEKWDSITRKWKDYEKLMRLIKLFLVDEVHILKEDRGATLEAIVSRMKSMATDVRFVALSATVPNLEDVATWLGRNSAEPFHPAASEKFGEEFRPVQLKKHVLGYQWSNNNDFAFEKALDAHLPSVISKYAEGKPIIVFCCTRNSTAATAKALASWWTTRPSQHRPWRGPSRPVHFQSSDLRNCAASGVLYHHAGIESDERIAIEKAFLNGEISVICCTSTLAVGVNLPCHLVIIKNTVTFARENMLQEYSDLEVMQMLGRAGRPQFDDSAVAVIMTRQSKVAKYEKMVTGQEILESTLHLNLIEHLNVEIGLGTIRDLYSARQWLTSTFLYVRLKHNPAYYKLDGARSGQSVDEQLDDICFRDVTLLREANLVIDQEDLRCTEFGHAMARYFVHFDSMQILMGLPPKASISETLSAIAQASEFESFRFRSGEKALYKIINKSPYIRFPIPLNLDLPAHKASLLIQSVLGAADIAWEGDIARHRVQYSMEAGVVFKHATRLVRCVIDCQISLGDSISINNALMLERSLTARVWDDSPLQMKQIDGIGVVGVRKLTNIGVRSIEELDCTDAHQIEIALGRNPPYGLTLLEKLKSFPKLRVLLHIVTTSAIKSPDGVKIQVKADIGFMNEKVPTSFNGRAIYVCLLAETSDGRKVHFARISAKYLERGQNLIFPALLTSPNLSINCYIMCDGIAGTTRSASVRPKVPLSMFPTAKSCERSRPHVPQQTLSNISKRRTESATSAGNKSASTDEFGNGDIDDDELVKASFRDLDFDHIDNYANPTDYITRRNTAKNTSTSVKARPKPGRNENEAQSGRKQMENGKWACNHSCKDKQSCRHLCCKEGMDKPPKKSGPKCAQLDERSAQSATAAPPEKEKKTQTKLQLTASKRKASKAIEELDLTHEGKRKKVDYAINGPKDYRDLQRLHKSVQKIDLPSPVSAVMNQKPTYCYGKGGNPDLSFMESEAGPVRPGSPSSDYGDIAIEDLTDEMHQPQASPLQSAERVDQDSLTRQHEKRALSGDDSDADHPSETFGDDESFFGDALVGIADSEELRVIDESSHDVTTQEEAVHKGCNPHPEYKSLDDPEFINLEQEAAIPCAFELSPSAVKVPHLPPETGCSLFVNNTSSPRMDDKNILLVTITENTPLLELKEPGEKAEPSGGMFGTRMPSNEREDVAFKNGNDKQEAENIEPKDEPIPKAYRDLQPWVYEMFGGIVELVD